MLPLWVGLLTPGECTSDAAYRYTEGKLLYENLNFGLDCDSRVAIVGPNGAGKSTMLSLLEAEILPVEGAISRHTKLRTAKFTQHHIDMMDLEGGCKFKANQNHSTRIPCVSCLSPSLVFVCFVCLFFFLSLSVRFNT
jgi:hypothetical protein